jgi:hypothetical protein
MLVVESTGADPGLDVGPQAQTRRSTAVGRRSSDAAINGAIAAMDARARCDPARLRGDRARPASTAD